MLAEIRRRRLEEERERVARDADAIRARCHTLAGFVREAWRVLEPATGYVHGWHIDAICQHLEAITHGRFLARGVPNRLLINVPPGTMKSLLVSVMWPAWEWGPAGMPGLRYLSTSYSEKYAKRDARRMRDLVSSEWYQALWPHVRLTRSGEMSFANDHYGLRDAVPFASLTAGRGDRLIIDDPHSTETAESDAERETAIRIFRESVPSRINNPEESAIVIVMQRLHDRDVSGTALELGLDYQHLMLPMEYDPARVCQTAIGFSDPRRNAGELLAPERFSRETIDRFKRAMTPYAWAGQYQQDPVPRSGGYFKAEWFIDAPPPPREALNVYGASDYAVTEGGGDYTVHVVIGIDREGKPHLLDLWRKQSAPDEWADALCDLILKWRPIAWAEETGQIRSSVGPLLVQQMRRRGAYVAREAFPTRGDKATRAQSIRGLMAIEGLRIRHDAPWRADLINECLRFPAGVHDDAVDALGLAGQLLDRMHAASPAVPAAPRPPANDYGFSGGNTGRNEVVI